MPDRRSVLVVAHQFPPAAGSGSNRALAFARYLPLYAWSPVVLTTGVPWISTFDATLAAQIPRDLCVIRTRSLETRAPSGPPRGAPRSAAPAAVPSSLRRHLGHLKRFPDAHVGWAPFAIAAGITAIRRERPSVIYASGGPFTTLVVGAALQRLTGVPFVAELRDGWFRWNRSIFPDYPGWRGVLEERLEGTVLRGASRVVLVTEQMAGAFREQYAKVLPESHFEVISNGYDQTQLGRVQPRTPEGDGCFRIVHVGSLYYGRSVATFLQAAADLAREDASFARSVRIDLVGSRDATATAELERALEASPLLGNVRLLGQVDHAAALDAQRSADLLLLIVNTTEGAGATVPGKLFEYLASGTPILAIAPEGAEAEQIVARTRTGWTALAGDERAIRRALATAFGAIRGGTVPPPNAAEVERFDRRALTGALADLFDRVSAEARR